MIKPKRHFVFLFLAAAFMVAGSQAVNACRETGFSETTLEKFEKSKYVLIARGVSAEKVREDEKSSSLFGVKALKMVVEKSFKGNLESDDEIVLVEGSRSDDFDSFRESDVGRRYLLFLCARKQEPNVFQVSRGMNHYLADEQAAELRYHQNDAAEDLLYLEKLDERRGRTRIYGKIATNQDSYSQMGKGSVKIFKGVKVEIRGNGKTYETTTNEDGVFEIYDVPAGNYAISPKIPKGWKISEVSSYPSDENDLGIKSQIKVKAGRHASYSYDLDADNRVSGTVFDPSGNPLKNVCLELRPIAGKASDSFLTNDCTNADGAFEFEQIFGGDYLIIVNKDNVITAAEPFPTLFYPNVFEREKAGTITVVDGENQSEINVRIPEMRETITIGGTFLSSDGVPVGRAMINFTASETDQNIKRSAFTRTDENGRFSVQILKDSEGELSGTARLEEAQFISCPQIFRLIGGEPESGWRKVKSNILKISAGKNIENTELNLSFPSCNKQPLISRSRID